MPAQHPVVNRQLNFDAHFELPHKLRQRINRWQKTYPKSQFQQYGPLDKYFNLRFPEMMVKPQALLRREYELHVNPALELEMDNDDERENEIRDADTDEESSDDEAVEVVYDGVDAEDDDDDDSEAEDPNVSIDSTGAPVWVNERRFPDFLLCSYYEDHADGTRQHDQVRLIVEIGSLGRKLKANTPRDKIRILAQLRSYFYALGSPYRWSGTVMGLIVLEVHFTYPELTEEEWSQPKGDRRLKAKKWFSLYGTKWPQIMAKVHSLDVDGK